MARTGTWEISDEFWNLVEPLIPSNPRTSDRTCMRKQGGGRKSKHSSRLHFSAIVHALRTGTVWNALPREKFEGASSAMAHRKFQQWARAKAVEKIWRQGLAEYDALQGIAWHWEAADGTRIEAPLVQESVGANPTDRGKNGTKRNILADERGDPLSLVVSGANRHDSVSLEPLLLARVMAPPKGTIQNLCLDAAYVGKEDMMEENGLVPRIHPRGEEKLKKERDASFKPRRWVVELAHSWFNRFRKLIPRCEKTDLSHVALTSLVAAMIVLNKIIIIWWWVKPVDGSDSTACCQAFQMPHQRIRPTTNYL